MSDIVERLTHGGIRYARESEAEAGRRRAHDREDAIAEITRLRTEVAELRDAMKILKYERLLLINSIINLQETMESSRDIKRTFGLMRASINDALSWVGPDDIRKATDL